jgi:hypothetical protein
MGTWAAYLAFRSFNDAEALFPGAVERWKTNPGWTLLEDSIKASFIFEEKLSELPVLPSSLSCATATSPTSSATPTPSDSGSSSSTLRSQPNTEHQSLLCRHPKTKRCTSKSKHGARPQDPHPSTANNYGTCSRPTSSSPMTDCWH